MISQILAFLILLFSSSTNSNISATSAVNTLEVYPKIIYQGDPIMMTYGKQRVFIGTDLNQKTGTTTIKKDGLTTQVYIHPREVVVMPLSIPSSLGGNTKASQEKLVKSLMEEAGTLKGLISTTTQLWSKDFKLPLKNIIVTDVYGYSRETGSYMIPHKGTDFRATIGTPVYAMNSGQVLLVKKFRDYGNTVVIDHGKGIMTLYLHLSEFKVKKGDLVELGDEIALSGNTGYAEGAHLHISIKVDGLSIDPMVFMGFFK